MKIYNTFRVSPAYGLQSMLVVVLAFTSHLLCLCRRSLAAAVGAGAAAAARPLIGFQFRKIFRAVRLCGAESWNLLSSCSKVLLFTVSTLSLARSRSSLVRSYVVCSFGSFLCWRIVDFNCERSGSSSSSSSRQHRPKEETAGSVWFYTTTKSVQQNAATHSWWMQFSKLISKQKIK